MKTMDKPKRKPLSKKIRFEVFKRDSFTCQYCGDSAPNVLLNVDHIKPVFEGGDNDISNLITSCQACNSGKGKRKINDDSVLKKQKQQLDELNERRAQIEMQLKWREELRQLDDEYLDRAVEAFEGKSGCRILDPGKKSLKKNIEKFGLVEVMDAIEIACDQYLVESKKENESYTNESINKAFNYIGGICANKQKEEKNPLLKDFYYIRGILKNRFTYWYEYLNWQTIDWMKYGMENGLDIEDLKTIAKQSTSWSKFRQLVNEWIESLGGNEEEWADPE